MRRHGFGWLALAALAACSAASSDITSLGEQPSATPGAWTDGGAGNAAPVPVDTERTPARPATADDGPGATPGGNFCEAQVIRADPSIVDVLIVLDRSRSMTEAGRWAPAVGALSNVTGQLQGAIRFGLWMFPEPVDPIGGAFGGLLGTGCSGGELDVPPVLDNADAIATALAPVRPFGGTPTGPALDGARGYFRDQRAVGGAVPPQYVLLMTDGEPTCPSGNGIRSNPADTDAAYNAVDALLADGVQTYVIGYDSQVNPAFSTILDGLARRGGTGNETHFAVEDEGSLVTALTGIAGNVVSCSYTLDSEPARPDYVLVELDDQQINLDQADGWRLAGW